jgi:hypothetical protein
VPTVAEATNRFLRWMMEQVTLDTFASATHDHDVAMRKQLWQIRVHDSALETLLVTELRAWMFLGETWQVQKAKRITHWCEHHERVEQCQLLRVSHDSLRLLLLFCLSQTGAILGQEKGFVPRDITRGLIGGKQPVGVVV